MSCARGYNNDRNFSYNGLTIRVSSDNASHLNWLEEFLCPHFEVVEDLSHDCRIALADDDQRYQDILNRGAQPDGRLVDCFALDSGLVRLPLWKSLGSEQSIFDEERRVFYIVQQNQTEVSLLTSTNNMAARNALMRVVRELAMNHSHRTGRLAIHGSAFMVGDRGVMIAGPKGAGKTTLLIHVLRQGEAEYLSNDRVIVTFDAAGPTMRGMPTIVTVRQQTLDMFPDLRSRLLGSSFHPRLSLSETRHWPHRVVRPEKDGRFNLSPAQFCELLQVSPGAQGKLQAIVFPRVTRESGTIHLEQLSAEAAAVRLIDSLFSAHSAQKVSNVFVHSTSASHPDEAALQDLCLKLTSQVRCFECRLGWQAYQSKASAAMMTHVMG
jgi:hypothetical protein